MSASDLTVAYKGFDPDLTCRGFQYAVGQTFTTADAPVLCRTGFHACPNPFDVWSYYPPSSKKGLTRYAVVKVGGRVERSDDKVCAAELTVEVELSLPEFIQRGVDAILALAKSTKRETGDQSAATNTGDQSAATNTGARSAATNTGHWSAATNTGHWSAATNTGARSAATNTGHWSAATNTGARSAATNTGHWSAATNTGARSAATNTGDQSAATNTGDQSAAKVEGKGSVALATGYEATAAACKGSGFVLAERGNGGNIVSLHTGIPGQGGIKPDVFYTVRDGKLVEAGK